MDKLVEAALNDSQEALRRALTARAEENVARGLQGPIAVSAQILAIYDEYKRRAEVVLECIKRTLRDSSFRYYPELSSDLAAWFVGQLETHSCDIEGKLNDFHPDGKPTFAKFKHDLHQRIMAEVELASESYLTHHRQVVRSWWAANCRRLLQWLAYAIGSIILAFAVAWLTKKYIK